MSRGFRRQLGGELKRFWRRPRPWVGLGALLCMQGVLYALSQLSFVRTQFRATVWRLHEPLGIDDAFTALSMAVEVTGQSVTLVGAVALVIGVIDLVGREADEGTLRMIFCRPVSASSVLAQKLVVATGYTFALALTATITALVLGVLLEPSGTLAVVSTRESIFGVHEFGPGLVRYAAAIPLLAVSLLTIALFALALACLPLKPATAATAALVALFTDWGLHTAPVFAAVSPYTVTTRLLSWRQVFNDTIPWLRLQRNYGDLLLLDLMLLVAAWWAFRRRPLIPR